MSMQLTADQKQSYAEDGFLIVRDVFAAELERLERGVMRAVRSGNCVKGDKSYPTPAPCRRAGAFL